jgi:phospholipase C
VNTGLCGTGTPLAGQSGRCGSGPRLPFLVILPSARHGQIDHTLTDFSSIDKVIEDSGSLPRIPGFVDSIAGSINSPLSTQPPGAAPDQPGARALIDGMSPVGSTREPAAADALTRSRQMPLERRARLPRRSPG